jgi:hypothetical protein
MMIARSVAFDHDLDLANDYADPQSLIQIAPEQHVRTGRDGHTRPVHDIGMPVLASPMFAAAYRLSEEVSRLPESIRRRAKLDGWIALRQLVSLMMIAVTTALALQFFEFLTTLAFPAVAAFFATVIWALAPPVLSHGYVFFTEIPTALIALIVYRALSSLPSRTALGAVGIGALAGLLLLLHTRNAGLLLGLLIVAAIRLRWTSRPAIAFGSGVALLLLVRVAVNQLFWGTLLTTPLARVGAWPGVGALVAEILLRGTGMLFDPNHGLLLSAPIYLLVPCGWLLLRRRGSPIAGDIAIIDAAYVIPVLLPMLNVQGWRGGWSPAARFLTPVSPFLGICVAVALKEARRSPAIVALCILQTAITAVFWSSPMSMWSDASAGSPFIAQLAGRALADALPRWDSWYSSLAALSAVLLMLWLLWAAYAAKRLSLAARRS